MLPNSAYKYEQGIANTNQTRLKNLKDKLFQI